MQKYWIIAWAGEGEHIDVLIISGAKIDDNFPIGNFLINCFSTLHHSDHDPKGEVIMLCVSKDILSNLLATKNKLIERL